MLAIEELSGPDKISVQIASESKISDIVTETISDIFWRGILY